MQVRDSSPLKLAFLDLVARRQAEAPGCRLIGFGVSRHRFAGGEAALDAGRVLDMPISEEAILGLAVGLSRVGAETFVDLMFDAFAARGWDVLTNQAALSALGGFAAPLTVRLLTTSAAAAGPQHGGSNVGLLGRLPHVLVAAPIAAADVERAWGAGRWARRPLLLLTPDRMPAVDSEPIGDGIAHLRRLGGPACDHALIAPGVHAAIAMQAVQQAGAWSRVALIVPLFLNPLPEAALTSITSGMRRTAFLEGPPPATIGDRLACEHWALWDQGSELDASQDSVRLAERLVRWLRK